jgi:APA family basic amino acid/polyamine antiporter
MALLSRKSISSLQSEASEWGEGGLRRALGGLPLLLLGTGTIVGTDVFMLTGNAAASYAGPGVVLSIVLAGIACALAALCYAELASVIPVAGGAYSYAYATLGEFFAWVVGWNLMLEYAVAATTAAVRWSERFVRLVGGFGVDLPPAWTAAPIAVDAQNHLARVPGTAVNVPAVGLVLLLTLLLVLGIRGSATFNSAAVFITITVVFFVVGFGFIFVNAENWHPFVPPNTGHVGQYGWSGVLRGAGVVFFAYIGFEAVSTVAREARNPQRDMPIAILGSLAVGTILCTLVALVMTGMAHFTELRDAAPAAVAIAKAGPDRAWLQVAVELGSLAGYASLVLVMLLAQPRVVFAMSRDGLLPPPLGRVHAGFRTPHVTTILAGLIVAAAAGLLPAALLARLTNIGIPLVLILVCAGVWVLRVRSPEIPRAFRTPAVPVVPLLGIVSCVALMASLPRAAWVRLLVWLVLGVAVYLLSGRRRSRLGAPPVSPAGGA